MSDYGRGSVYQRGNVWWLRYWNRGKRYQESSGSTKKADAVKLLNQRLAASPKGVAERTGVTFETLADVVRRDYRLNDRKSSDRLELSLKHLAAAFAGFKAEEIKADEILGYQDARKKAGAAPATVNLELAALKRAFTLGLELELVESVPTIKNLKVNNVRKGFFEEAAFQDVLAHLPADIKPIAETGYITGWRLGELLSRCWCHVDLGAGWIRLEPGETKNGEGRQFPIIPRLRRVLEEQHDRKVQIEQTQGRIIAPLFFAEHGRAVSKGHLHHYWHKARVKAGHPELLFHDFRRTAVRNLTRSGVPRSVAKELTGHRTDSVFARYNIVEEQQLAEAGAKLTALLGG